MKILNSADWHINLRSKKVPKDWQINRFNAFFQKIYEYEKQTDIHIIAGDLFDKAPNLEETCLLNSFLHNVSIPTYIIPGNHEATRKGESFLENYILHNAITNPNVHIFTKNADIEILGTMFQFFPYGEMQKNKVPEYVQDSILVTHIRGEIPPHITEEFDFNKLRQWKLILLGDLHVNMKYKDYQAYYPGSPMNVAFDRNEDRMYGINIIDFTSIDDYIVIPIDLKLPRLIRKTITAEEELLPGTYNHIIYEVTDSLDKLSNIKDNKLLDKKISFKPNEASKLDLSKASELVEELAMYLEYIKVEKPLEVVKEFNNLNVY